MTTGSLADATKQAPEETAPLAPKWHTALLIVGLSSVGLLGYWASRQQLGATEPLPPMGATFRIFAVYAPMIAVQAAIVGYVVRLGRPRSALRSLIGRGWDSPRRAGEDLGLSLVAWLFVLGGETLWARLSLSRASVSAPVAAVLPHTAIERAAWVLVALSVGFAEELTYRGYLQTQLAAFTRNVTIGIVLSALLFGAVHAEQGVATALRFTVYGLGFGLLAHRRKSLVAGIVCHSWIDVVGGLLRG